MSSQHPDQTSINEEQLSNESRRAMLIKAARVSAYAVPASIVMLSSKQAAAVPAGSHLPA